MEGSTTEPSVDARASRAGRRWIVFFALAAGVVVVDQLTKAWVTANFQPASVHPLPGANAPTPILGDFVRIALNHNDGGIFGLFGAAAPVLAIASLGVIALILVYQARQGTVGHPLLSATLGLLLGGAIGNLLDRLRLGYVVDFVDMGIGTLRWFTFNVADAALSTSIVLLLVLGIIGDRYQAGARSDAAEPGGEGKGSLPQGGPTAAGR